MHTCAYMDSTTGKNNRKFLVFILLFLFQIIKTSMLNISFFIFNTSPFNIRMNVL